MASAVIRQNTPPKNDSHLIKLISGEAPAPSKPDLKNIPHVALYLTITSSEDDDEPDKVTYHYIVLCIIYKWIPFENKESKEIDYTLLPWKIEQKCQKGVRQKNWDFQTIIYVYICTWPY